jgi:phosphoglycolate phosphatase
MHIIFDFDGTLVDSKDYMIGLYNSLASDSNRPHITREIFKTISKISMFERFKLLNTSILEISSIYHVIEQKYFDNADNLYLFDGISELIRDLSINNKLYILSTNTKRIIRKVVENNSLTECFTNFYTNKNLFGKASSLKRIIKTNLLNASQVIYIGDEERDVIASRKAKLAVASVAWGFDSRELLETTGPDFIAETPDDLKKYIEELDINEKV